MTNKEKICTLFQANPVFIQSKKLKGKEIEENTKKETNKQKKKNKKQDKQNLREALILFSF